MVNNEEVDEKELGGVSGEEVLTAYWMEELAIEVNWFNGTGVCGRAIVVGIDVCGFMLVGLTIVCEKNLMKS